MTKRKVSQPVDNRPLMIAFRLTERAGQLLRDGVDSHTAIAELTELAKSKARDMELPITDQQAENIAYRCAAGILGITL